jgi:hypothetical protein
MDTAVIATRLAYIFGGVTPPTNEPAIVLATHQLPDELKVDDLPALLVWPPAATPVIQSGMDRSRFRFPVVLYLPGAPRRRPSERPGSTPGATPSGRCPRPSRPTWRSLPTRWRR